MKNLLVLTYEYPPLGGGGGFCAFNLNKSFVEAGIEVTVITTWFHGLKREETTETGFIYRLPSRRKSTYRSNPLEMLDWARKAHRFALQLSQSKSFDHCLAHFVMPGGEVAKKLKRIKGIPFTVVSHGHDIPWVKPKNLYPLFAASYFRIKAVLRSADNVVTLSTQLQQNAKRLLPAKEQAKVEVIPNGADPQIFYPVEKKDREIFRVLFVGRLTTQKRPQWALEAFQNAQLTKASLTLIGDGPHRKALEQRAKENTHFLGKQDQKVVIDYLQQADVVVIPSQSEGFSLVMVEALFCNTFVLTTRVSGAEDLIAEGENGAFFSSMKELSALLKSYHKKPPNQAVQRNRNQIIRETYTWQQVAQRYLPFLK